MPKPSEQAAFGIYPQAGKRGQRKPTAKEQLAQIFSDERAMDLPKFGEVDLEVPSAANRAMSQRMVERDVDLKRQADRDMSPLEKIAGGMQTGRLIGSGLVNMAKSIPTAITKGGKAAEEYIAENIYKPTVPKAYEYAEDIGNFLQSLESDYKIPPIIPEAMMLQNVIGPATRQAGKATKQAARQGALNLAAPRTLNPQAGVIKMKGGNWLGGSVEGALKPLRRQTAGGNDPAEMLNRMRERYTPEEIAKLQEGLSRTHVLESIADLERDVALNNWVDRNLGNYIKKEMATPEDPVRRLAEEGILHIEPRNFQNDPAGWTKTYRAESGFPEEGLATSNLAKAWERASDEAIASQTAENLRRNLGEFSGARSLDDKNQAIDRILTRERAKSFDKLSNKELQEDYELGYAVTDANRQKAIEEIAKGQVDDYFSGNVEDLLGPQANFRLGLDAENNPLDQGRDLSWLEKVPQQERIYGLQNENSSFLGFDHILDVLRQDLAEGRIRPEQLNKVSMEQAVRRTYEYDQEMAKKMRETAIKQQEGFPIYKEYPEGYRWVELNLTPEQKAAAKKYDEEFKTELGRRVATHPGDKSGRIPTAEIKEQLQKEMGPNPMQGLEDALKYEGNTMGHCVGGYCPDVVEGRSRIFSLRDAKGEPHVTVEVAPPRAKIHGGADDAAYARIMDEADRIFGAEAEGTQEYMSFVNNKLDLLHKDEPPAIVQIKGKQNRAPKEDYLPYVQDFVRSGQWSDVGDLGNTGLYRPQDIANFIPESFYATKAEREAALEKAKAAGTIQPYMTRSEWEEALKSQMPPPTPGPTMEFLREMSGLPPEGMARGGRVHFSDNPDVMQLELARGGAVRMQVGGLAKVGAKGATKGAAKAAKVEKELALPPVLPRAPAKTKEEIRPYAQRMAQQMTGEFYRPNPKKSENVAGKSFSQFKMEKDLKHDIRPTREVVEPEVADIEKQLGMLKIGISGDTTIADKILHRAGPYELFDPSPQYGGPRYGLGGEGAWASNNPIAATVQKRVNELSEAYGAPPLGQYMAMGPQGSNFAQHFADANLQAIDTRAMTRRQIEQINKLIREGSEKSGPRPSFPGIEDKGGAYLHFAIDPELRKHFNDLMQKTSVTEKLNLPDGRIILHAITEPELRDKEILNTGFSQMRLKSAFDPESLQISAHPTYSHVIPHEEGSALTRTKYPVPGELEFSDVLDYAQQHYRPRDMTRVFQTSTPRQIVDPQHIDEMKMYEELMKEYTGKKKGGAVHKAAGGEITADDLILEERKL